MTKIVKKMKGFSLVEMIIYITILSFMLAVMISVTISIVTSQRSVRAERNVENSVMLTLERITRETRAADLVDTLSSIFDSNPGKLVLVGTDEDENPRTVEFYLSNGLIYLRENGVVVGPVSQSEAKATSLIFRLFSDAGVQGIRTEVTFESGTSTHYRTNNFYSSSVIR